MTNEFEGILQYADDTRPNRPVMSRPPRVVASTAFIREVAHKLDWPVDSVGAREVADWIVDKMERFGARTAQGVIDLNGNGPVCSWCGVIWPLCGHHHQSEVLADDDPDTKE